MKMGYFSGTEVIYMHDMGFLDNLFPSLYFLDLPSGGDGFVH